MALDLTLPDREEQVSDKETHVGMVTGRYPRLQHSELHFGLERWHSTTVSQLRQPVFWHGVQPRMISVDNFFVFLRLLFLALLLLYVT